MAHLFVELFRDAVNELVYMAELAGMKYLLEQSKYGLTASSFSIMTISLPPPIRFSARMLMLRFLFLTALRARIRRQGGCLAEDADGQIGPLQGG